MGLRMVATLFGVWKKWGTVKIQYGREKVREQMKPGYQVKKTLWKGGKGLFVSLRIDPDADLDAVREVYIVAPVR